MKKGLYINHRKQKCGVYEFGKAIGNLLLTSKNYEFHYCECDSFQEFKKFYKTFRPDIIIYNYTPITMSWLNNTQKIGIPLGFQIQAIHIGTIHEVYQQYADNADNSMFDFHIAPDPTLLLKNPLVYKTGRLLPQKAKFVENHDTIPTIGSFGFATPGKGFHKIINLVQEQFDEAIIKFTIPFARYGDNDGIQAKQIADECKKLINKKLIQLQINHDYLNKEELLSFLSANSINVFLYDDQEDRGISSVTDWALAAGRPVAISHSRLFRHLFHCKPSICIEQNSLKTILKNGTTPIQHLWDEFSPETVLWEYNRIIADAIQLKSKTSILKRTLFRFYIKKIFQKLGIIKHQKLQHNRWTKTNDQFSLNTNFIKAPEYTNIDQPENAPVNRILDNTARSQYKTTIDFLFTYFPELMSKKIPEANIQQAFNLDTAVRFSKNFENPNILAVGSFEDTAVEALKILDYSIYDIDPIVNYDLQTFLNKPHVKSESFDVIISTSVIEHVKDDEQFIKDIAYLLKPGGYAILTCDYNDQYKPGDDIPDVDYRFYTQKDLKERLMNVIPNCQLVGNPQWDCQNPDFFYLDKFNYTFASFVFQKK